MYIDHEKQIKLFGRTKYKELPHRSHGCDKLKMGAMVFIIN